MGEFNALNVEQHVETINVHEVVITPEHADRKESPEFRKSKERLREDGHYHCWVCDTTEELQVHHFGAEWSLAELVDFDKLKTFCEAFDIYGYGRLLKNKPMTSVDDIRNMMVVCQNHHTGKTMYNTPTGIHCLTFPVFVIQKLAKDGLIPVPQEEETIEQTEKRISEGTEK